MERHPPIHQGAQEAMNIRRIAIAFLPLFLVGCTYFQRRTDKIAVKLEEQGRALTTATVDALQLAPTNEFVNLALDLARHDQQIVGLPALRIDVDALLAGNKAEWDSLRNRYSEQRKLIQKNVELEAKLQSMGVALEKERNKTIVSRVWHWSLSTLGIGGIIALCIVCPALIPIFTQIIAWVVAKIPALASALGIVSKKAFDAVIHGIEKAKDPATKEAVNDATKEKGVSDLVHALVQKATKRKEPQPSYQPPKPEHAPS
jgi:hypothetical protein